MSASSSQAVFLSYASEDAAAARRICEALRAAGIEVWFDQNELVGGDAWDAKIRKQIGTCALFVPIVSACTQARLEGYFRLEWKLAAQRTHTMADEKTFLLPVVIDATRDADAKVPAEFKAVQWTRLADGETTPAFVTRVQQLLGGVEVGRVSDPPSENSPRERAGQRPALPQAVSPAKVGRQVPAAAWAAALAVIALGAGATYFTTRRSESAAPNVGAGTHPPTAAPATTPPAVSDKSIAVLPFANLSDDKDSTSSFCDGMHEDILTSLANIRELRVISRTSVMEYRNTTKKIPQIARELGVAYILEGSVRRAGDQVRITGQLIRASSDEHLWAKNYDKELTPKAIFAIQSALAMEIAGALHAAISPTTQKRLERRPTENLAAYDLYLKARQALQESRSRLSLEKAETLLAAVVKLDPKFAAAWAATCDIQYWAYINNLDRSEGRLRKAETAANQAARLAPETPEALRAMARYRELVKDRAGARIQLEKLLTLQPSDSEAYELLSALARREGQWAKGVQLLRKALELDPANTLWQRQLVGYLRDGRRYDDARAAVRADRQLQPDRITADYTLAEISFEATGSTTEIDRFFTTLDSESKLRRSRRQWALITGNRDEWLRWNDPDWEFTHIYTAWMLAAHGDLDGARQSAELAKENTRQRLVAEPDNSQQWAILGAAEAILGHQEEALRCVDKGVALLPESTDAFIGSWRSANRAHVLGLIGRKDEAIAEYARLLKVPNTQMNVHVMRRHPWFFPVRDDPRFQALLNDPKNNAPLF